VIFEVLGQKTLFFGQKVRKSSEKSLEKLWKFRKNFGNFGNWFFRTFGNFGNFGNLEIPNFPKTLKKWRPIRTSEIMKYSFRLGNRPKSSVKSSECRALIPFLNFFLFLRSLFSLTEFEKVKNVRSISRCKFYSKQ
jgi:hypothetical protein